MPPARSIIEPRGLSGLRQSSLRSDNARHRVCGRCLGQTRTKSDLAEAYSRSSENGERISPKQHQKMLNRDFFLSVFSASATKRDAKAYLSRYKEETPKTIQTASESMTSKFERQREDRLRKSGVNLGRLYGQARAIEQSPVFRQGPVADTYPLETPTPIQVAVVKIRDVDKLDAPTRRGVALTLAQLSRLGLQSCIVVDVSPKPAVQDWQEWRKSVVKQCFKLANAVNAQSQHGARVLDQALGVASANDEVTSGTAAVQGPVTVVMHENLLATLQRDFVTIIPPIAYNEHLQAQRVDADEVVLALTRELAGLSRPRDNNNNNNNSTPWPTHVDKVMVLDPLGGLPAVDKPDQSHIFVNLEQEYQSVRNELLLLEEAYTNQQPINYGHEGQLTAVEATRRAKQIEQHVKNLDLLKNCLSLLPPASSALLTTPSEAASSAFARATRSTGPDSVPGVGTRTKRNPLIHNLLTDKPLISSSLPVSRVLQEERGLAALLTPATFFKRGMPLTIIPDPKLTPWAPPKPGDEPLRLESDPRIDFPRLLHLIEDSFGRPLDVQHYLDRIKGRIAGIIVAGEYEGGAILTWESPTSQDTASNLSRPPVPYLDKFAVLRKSQGSGGVADIVFNAMVRTCLPDGVVWRSRKNNPVNKWYFERSEGTWKLPNSQWCMFWTGKEVDFKGSDATSDAEKRERWNDFVSVCSGIEASWADRDRRAPD